MGDDGARRRLDSSSEEEDEPRDARVRVAEESDDSDGSAKLSKEERKAARKEKKRRRKEAKKEKKERKRLRKSERPGEDDAEDDEPAAPGLKPPVAVHNSAAAAGEVSSATSAPKLGKRRSERARCPRQREGCVTSALLPRPALQLLRPAPERGGEKGFGRHGPCYGRRTAKGRAGGIRRLDLLQVQHVELQAVDRMPQMPRHAALK